MIGIAIIGAILLLLLTCDVVVRFHDAGMARVRRASPPAQVFVESLPVFTRREIRPGELGRRRIARARRASVSATDGRYESRADG